MRRSFSERICYKCSVGVFVKKKMNHPKDLFRKDKVFIMNGNHFFDDLEDIILKAKPWLGPLMCPIDVPLTKMDSGMSPSTPWTR